MIDLTAMTDTELVELREALIAEQEKRLLLRTAPQQVAQLNQRVLAAEGVTSGDEWRQPAGAHDAYPKGWMATHNGAEWESLTPANVWEPGVSSWRQVGTDGPAEWVQPTGTHDAYSTGDRVTFEGKVYESTVDGNVWAPVEYPDAWRKVD